LDELEILNTTTGERALKPLRILIILNLEWNQRLGAARVYMELAEQWRAAGHFVERFSLSDAFPETRGSGAGFAIRQLLFAYKAATYVKNNSARFDLIDALIGALPMSKEKLGFDGLLVARSVGLYRLYDRFERSVSQRWPRLSRGKFLGKIFYTLARKWLTAASNDSVQHADLVNVPNAEEADCLHAEIDPDKPILVQPYGLSAERRRALSQAASLAKIRLAQKKISFIGMWAPRKGSHDWAQIISRIRSEIPDAQFRFLGTMVDARAVLKDLETESSDGIEFVSEYAPADLPTLLSDCAVGAFPSYVEGFGLAVLEQLAAGIPTVSFDVPGPHEMLHQHLPELLVPSGDIQAFAAAICKILNLDLGAYENLANHSRTAAAEFNWSAIAHSTLEVYGRQLSSMANGALLFVQPFGLGSAGGGARILRALLPGSPLRPTIVCTSPEPPRVGHMGREIHLPLRPYFGKIERSRLRSLPAFITPLFEKKFMRRFVRLCQEAGATAIHAVPHSYLDFYHAYRAARELRVPFYLQIHDDFAYSSRGQVAPERAHEAMLSAWRGANARFVICDQLGKEYCHRYGVREYIVVTDGLESIARAPAARRPGEFHIYFMGLFHLEYEENLLALSAALERLRTLRPLARISMTLRCDALRPRILRVARDLLRVLPFAPEARVHDDLKRADLLYLPLPFGAEFEPLVRLSLSTKLVTYVGSGVPILYHGPKMSVAYELLAAHSAALFHTSLNIDSLTEALCRIYDDPQSALEISSNALKLARSHFRLSDQRAKFWNAIMRTRSGDSVATNSPQTVTVVG
jgi:glycosyltransferase involved in cell wall biosynthesis